MTTRRLFSAGAVAALAAVFSLTSVSAAHAAVFEAVDASPSDIITTVNGDITVTTTLGPQAFFDLAYSAWGSFGTDGSGIPVSYVEWSFSQPVYQLTVNYFAVESAGLGGTGDPHSFSTNLGPVDLSPVAGGGNFLQSSDLDAGQPQADYVGDSAVCTLVAPAACSGTIELRFPSGITSLRSFNGGLADSGFNATGLALATDVVDPAASPAAGAQLAASGAAPESALLAGTVAVVVGAALVIARRRRTSDQR